MPGEVRVLSTTSTPPSWAATSAKVVSREPATCCTPSWRSRARLDGLPAVAMASAPMVATTCKAASPTPPAAAGTSTVSPRRSAAAWPNTASMVMNTVGVVAACSKVMLGGMPTRVRSDATTWEPREPAARPNTRWPGYKADPDPDPDPPCATATTTPAQSPPGAPGSPGYMPSTLSTSRKLTPTWVQVQGSGFRAHRVQGAQKRRHMLNPTRSSRGPEPQVYRTCL